MVGAGDVVAEGGGALLPDEQAAGGQDRGGERLDLGPDQLEVLGGEGVRQRDRLARGGDLDEGELRLAHGGTFDEELAQAPLEPVAVLRGARHGGHEAAVAVLRLGEHVEGDGVDHVLRRPRAEHDQEVARTGEAVDPDDCRELVLGLLDVQVARPHDHVDGGDRLGAVGEGRDRLGAAHPVHAFDPAQPAGAEDGRIDAGDAARGGAHRHVEHARGAGGDDAHHDGARIRRTATRNVDGRRCDGHLPQRDAVTLGQLDGDVHADTGVGDDGDVGDRDLEPGHELAWEPDDRLVELLWADEQGRWLGSLGVELACALPHGGVAARADALDDRPDGLVHRRAARDQLP